LRPEGGLVSETIWSGMPVTRAWESVDAGMSHGQIRLLNRPAILRGRVEHWPAVAREAVAAVDR